MGRKSGASHLCRHCPGVTMCFFSPLRELKNLSKCCYKYRWQNMVLIYAVVKNSFPFFIANAFYSYNDLALNHILKCRKGKLLLV